MRDFLRHVVPADARPTTVGRYLEGSLKLSTTLIRRMKVAGGIRLGTRVVRTDNAIGPGDELVLGLPPREAPGVIAEEMPLTIAYEDDDLIVLDKPAGQVVHPTKGEYAGTLANGLAWLFAAREEPAGIHPTHRIDRDTSGLVLFAKHPLAHQRLDAGRRAGDMARTYMALAWGRTIADELHLDGSIAHSGLGVLREVGPDGQVALTTATVVERFPDATLFRVVLATGRTHQIRVHLADIGQPLLGDRMYAPDRDHPLGRHALHAAELGFHHPGSGDWLSLASPMPADMVGLLVGLRSTAVNSPPPLPHP